MLPQLPLLANVEASSGRDPVPSSESTKISNPCLQDIEQVTHSPSAFAVGNKKRSPMIQRGGTKEVEGVVIVLEESTRNLQEKVGKAELLLPRLCIVRFMITIWG